MPSDWNVPGMRYVGMGLELAASVVVLTLLGWWVDRHFGTAPWGVLTGALIGIIGGMYNMVREALEAARTAGGGGRAATGDDDEGTDGP